MIGIDFSDLVALFEYGRALRDGESYVESPPTPSSLAMIRREIGCDLPSYFVKFAMACPAYTTYFALLGDDVNATGQWYEPHITFIYKYAPDGYVPLAQRADTYIMYKKCDPEGPIYNLNEAYIDENGVAVDEEFEEIASSFREFLEVFVIRLAVGSRAALRGERGIRELEERARYVRAALEKYQGASELINEIDRPAPVGLGSDA